MLQRKVKNYQKFIVNDDEEKDISISAFFFLRNTNFHHQFNDVVLIRSKTYFIKISQWFNELIHELKPYKQFVHNFI